MLISTRHVLKQSLRCAVSACALVILAGCKEKPAATLQGYIEGEYLYMAPPAPGVLKALLVETGDQATSGAVLFTMDSTKEEAAVLEARSKLAQGQALLEDARLGKRETEINSFEAQLKQAEAGLDLATKVFERQKQLFSDRVIAAEELDRARSDAQQKQQAVQQARADLETARQGQRTHQVEAAEASVRALTAAVAQADWNYSQTTQTTPMAGLVFDTYFRPGETVPAGRPVVSVLPPERVKAIAFVTEPHLAPLQIGTSATVTMDGHTHPASGHVSFISPQAEFTPPVIYSREMRQKLTYRIEISFPPGVATTLHPGQPVDVFIEGVTP